MSSVRTVCYRKNDHRKTEANIALSTPQGCISTIEFHDIDGPLMIHSADRGYIEDQKVWVEGGSVLKVEFSPRNRHCECIISHLSGDELLSYENYHLDVNSDDIVSKTSEEVLIGAEGRTMAERLSKIKSDNWKIKIEVKSDIIVHVEKCGKGKSYFAFGSESKELSTSDFVFVLHPETSRIVIPRQVFWKKHSNANPGDLFGCFELVKVNFHSLSNIYYKALVSNRLQYSDFPRRTDSDLSLFSDPLGRSFGPQWAMDAVSALPVFVGKL